MRKATALIGALVIAFVLSACGTSGSEPDPSSSSAISTPAPSLIPPAPGTEIKAIDPSFYDVGFSEFLFRSGAQSMPTKSGRCASRTRPLPSMRLCQHPMTARAVLAIN